MSVRRITSGRLATQVHRGDRGPTGMMPVQSTKVLVSDMTECSCLAVFGSSHSWLVIGRRFSRVMKSSCRIIFLSLVLFECRPVFQECGRASFAVAGARRSRLVAVRHSRLREEQLESFELLKKGREEKAYARDAAAEEVRVAALHAQRKAL